MIKKNNHSQIRLEAKRHTELWIYSFADMYMILSVFFIAVAVIFAAKAKNSSTSADIPSAGRGPTAVKTMIAIEFERGSNEITGKAEESLRTLLPALRSSKGAIELEGYADGKSVEMDSGEFSSTLDLSSARAVRVAEWLIENGVAARRLRTSSFGDSGLYETDDNGIRTNRRVVLKVLPVEGG
jgi:outer membrane protein OmpA-like peptidoglycan-associated protein